MKKIVAFIAAALLFSSTVTYAGTFDPGTLPVTKQTISGKYLSAKEAYDVKIKNGTKVLMIDVRTPAEIEYVGIADQVDLNIPYMLDDYSSWDSQKSRFLMKPNSAFTMNVEDAIKARGLTRADIIICICRSGDRSSVAATLLNYAGYTNVYSVYDGFEGDMGKEVANAGRRIINGWKNDGLPWGYSLTKERVYFID